METKDRLNLLNRIVEEVEGQFSKEQLDDNILSWEFLGMDDLFPEQPAYEYSIIFKVFRRNDVR